MENHAAAPRPAEGATVPRGTGRAKFRGMPPNVKAVLPGIFGWAESQLASSFQEVVATREERNRVGHKYTLVDAMFSDVETEVLAQWLPSVTSLSTPRQSGVAGISAQRVTGRRPRPPGQAFHFKLTSRRGNQVNRLPGYHARMARNTAPFEPGTRVYFVLREGTPGCLALRMRSDFWERSHIAGGDAPELPFPRICNWNPGFDPAPAAAVDPAPATGADPAAAAAAAASAAAAEHFRQMAVEQPVAQRPPSAAAMPGSADAPAAPAVGARGGVEAAMRDMELKYCEVTDSTDTMSGLLSPMDSYDDDSASLQPHGSPPEFDELSVPWSSPVYGGFAAGSPFQVQDLAPIQSSESAEAKPVVDDFEQMLLLAEGTEEARPPAPCSNEYGAVGMHLLLAVKEPQVAGPRRVRARQWGEEDEVEEEEKQAPKWRRRRGDGGLTGPSYRD